MPDYLVREEDGTSKFTLEDSSGSILLETGLPGRVSQHPVEAALSPTSGQARLSQLPVETIIAPTDAQARVSQMVVEVVVEIVPGYPTLQVIIIN